MAPLGARVCARCGKPKGCFAYSLPGKRGYWHLDCFAKDKAGVPVGRRGRQPATGRFADRAELVAAVRADYHSSGPARTIPIIARNHGVSAAVVRKILDSGEGSPSPKAEE